MPTYTLPELSYDFGALEPHISARIIELHHDKHHAAYVKGANTTLEKLEEARAKGDFAALPALERALAFHVSGHVLHSLFWENLAPKAGGRPDGALATAIDKDFGSFDAFKKQLNEAAGTVMGSGWAALVWEPLAQKLLISQIYDHQSNVAQGSAPLLVVDAWEHAFYLQYENRKTEFFDALWNVFNWQDVSRKLEAARAVVIKPAAKR
ncbi:MAG TPA: superoxide dismutase [Polyangia bacterium]|jgi:Fe-Mn family superoxide dismutase|nr:superoxide dismutase [Polyangia bacterium]